MASDTSFANLLECPICYEQFKTAPKQLPCKHTLCEACLQGLVQYNFIVCPECREESPVPTGGVAAFPNDLTMQRFLEHHRTQALQLNSNQPQYSQVQKPPSPVKMHGGNMTSQHDTQLDIQRSLQGALLLMERDREVFTKANQSLHQEKQRYQQWRVAASKRITDVLDSVEGIVRQRKEHLLKDIETIHQRALVSVETEEVKLEVKKQGMDKLCLALSDKLSLSATVGARNDHEQVAAILSQAQAVDTNLQKGLELQLTQLNLLETGMDNLLAGIRGWGNVTASPQMHKIHPPSSAGSPRMLSGQQQQIGSPVQRSATPVAPTSPSITKPTVPVSSQPPHQTGPAVLQQVNAPRGRRLVDEILGRPNQGNAPPNQGNAPPSQEHAPSSQGHAPVQGQAPSKLEHPPISQEQTPVSQGEVLVQEPPPAQEQGTDDTQVPMKPQQVPPSKTSHAEHIEQQPSSRFISMGKMALQFGYDGGPGLLSSPLAVAELPNGSLAITNGMTYEIKIFNNQGQHLKSITLPSRGSFKHGLTGLAIHPAGHICASNPDRREVQLLSIEGQVKGHLRAKVSIGEEKFCPWGVACTVQGTVYVCDRANHKVRVFNPSGTYVSSFGGRGKDLGKLDYPTGIAVLGNGEVAVVDSNNNRIQVFTPEGAALRSFGTEGTCLGELKGPADISVDQNGFIAVSETSNHRVQIFNPAGQPLATFGNVGSEGGQFASPRGVVISKEGNVVVCDTKNDRVQIFQ